MCWPGTAAASAGGSGCATPVGLDAGRVGPRPDHHRLAESIVTRIRPVGLPAVRTPSPSAPPPAARSWVSRPIDVALGPGERLQLVISGRGIWPVSPLTGQFPAAYQKSPKARCTPHFGTSAKPACSFPPSRDLRPGPVGSGRTNRAATRHPRPAHIALFRPGQDCHPEYRTARPDRRIFCAAATGRRLRSAISVATAALGLLRVAPRWLNDQGRNGRPQRALGTLILTIDDVPHRGHVSVLPSRQAGPDIGPPAGVEIGISPETSSSMPRVVSRCPGYAGLRVRSLPSARLVHP
jgi:hypothetical protein